MKPANVSVRALVNVGQAAGSKTCGWDIYDFSSWYAFSVFTSHIFVFSVLPSTMWNCYYFLMWKNSYLFNIFSWLKHVEYLIVFIIVAVFFCLQARHLHQAVAIYTDEGVYAQVGRMIWQGDMPHKDIPLWHMPLLPIIIGFALNILPNIYFLRIIFLIIHLGSAVLLFHILRKMNDYGLWGAITAAVFYLSFFEMVHHDFRFLAIRQILNDILIIFIYFGLNFKIDRKYFLVQTILAALSVFLFLPAAFYLAVLSLGIILSNTSASRKKFLVYYCDMAFIIVTAVMLYFAFIPNAFQQVVLDQMQRYGSDRLPRLLDILGYQRDGHFYLLGLLGLILGIIIDKKFRWIYGGMIGVFLFTLYLPKYFFPHYMVTAGMPVAFGIYALIHVVDKIMHNIHHSFSKYIVVVCGCMIIFHFYIVISPLLNEWSNNRNPDYHDFIQFLKHSPEPLLAAEPIFAVQSARQLTPGIENLAFRPPVQYITYNYDKFLELAKTSCTIVLTHQFPHEVRDIWEEKYRIVLQNKWGNIIYTDNPGCSEL